MKSCSILYSAMFVSYQDLYVSTFPRCHCSLWMFARTLAYRRVLPAVRSLSTSLPKLSIKGFFAASNYAIVGASTKPGSLGHIICENYKRTFKGETFYVNPKGSSFWILSFR